MQPNGDHRVLLGGGPRLLIEALQRLLESEGGLVAAVTTHEDAPSDVCLLVAGGRGDRRALASDATSLRRSAGRDAPLLLLIEDGGGERLAAELGAVGSLGWRAPAAELVAALREAAREGRLSTARARSRRPETGDEETLVMRWLTQREREVLQLLAVGRGTDEIAAELGILPNTVRTHVQNILGKVGVSSRLAAVSAARRAGLISRGGEEGA